jgi:PKD repeat protein/N-acetylneuraminic acid mutarotase
MSIHGGLSLPAASRVSNSQVDGAVTAGDSSHVEQTITTGSISLSSGSVLTSSVKGSVSLNSGLVQANTVTGGGISLGSGQALSNTMTGGGLSLGDGSYARFNNIQDCPGTGITTSGSVTLVKNRVVDCAQGISLSGGVLQESLVANHGSSGLEINGDATVISNTFTGNAGSAVRLLGGTTFTLRNNNLEENKGTYDLENRIIKTTLPILIASQNWWGTTASSVIDQRIFDYNDDYTLSRVTFAPVLSGPETGAPAYVRSVTIDPSPAGIETVHFDVQFSREMDTAQIPALDTLWNRSDVWIAKASMPTARSGLAAVVLNSKIYAIGGLHGNTYIGSVEDYDPSSNTWKMHNTPIYAPGDTAAAVLNGKIYTIGGSIYTSWVVEYDPESDTIRAHSIMPIPRRDCAAVALNGKIYFISCHQQSLNSSSVEEYDPATDTWTTKASLLTARYKPAAAALDGKIFVIGGLDPSGNGLSTVEVYDPASDIWTERTSLPTSRNKLAAVALDGKIYVVGGVDSNWNYLSTLEVFDPASDTWTERASMPSARYGLAATVFDGKVYTFGGFGTGGDLSTVAAYQPAIQYPLENPSWSSSTTSQATLQVTSLTLRGGYTVTVQGAYGSDGLLIAPNSSSTFTVDYASAIADVTPPIIPIVAACSGTESGTLSASWSASDPETQITLYRYAIGAAPGGSEIVNWTTTASVSFARSDLGLIKGQAYYVSVQARNDGGLWSEVAPSNGVIAGSGGCPQASWSAAPTSGYAPLAVAFSSEVTGAIQTRAWSFGDGGSSALDAPVYTYTLPGTYTVTLDVRGPSGRMISSQSEYIHVALDNQPPVGTVTLPGEASMVSGTQVTLQLSVTDPQSGVSEMRFSNDAGNTNALTAWSAWEPFTSTKVWTLSTGDGQKTVYIQFKDRTGNVSSNFEVVVLLDTTAPDGSVQINGGAAAAGSPAVILTLAATDSGSGQIQMHFSNDNRSWSAWEAFTATKNWTLSAGEGAKTVYVQFRDALGNLATYNAQITLDNTGPTGSIAINSGAAATSSPTVTLALSASDPSGLDGMRFSNDSSSWSAWEAFAASKAWTVSTGDGTKTIYVQFRDSLGNINTLSAEISLIDLTSGLYLPLIQG